MSNIKAAVPDTQWYGSFCDAFTALVLNWYDRNKRVLPWRDRENAYYTWVSEIMLQQTRSVSVIPFFNRFIEELPDISHLAECPKDKLMKLWEGLGYYNRAGNLQKAAILVMREYGGTLPGNARELRRLPGIGPYTAAAVASIAFGERIPAVDGNVLRLTARLLGSCDPVDSEPFRKRTEEFLERFIPEDRPGDFNQALMEIGALVCRPNKMPECRLCPLKMVCRAHLRGETSKIPVKQAKKRRRIIPLTVFLVQDDTGILLRKRPDTGLLAGLYEFPNTEGLLEEKEALDAVKELGYEAVEIERLPDASHVFTHIEWKMRAWRIRIDSLKSNDNGCIAAVRNTAGEKYAIPSAFKAYVGYLKEDWT